MARCQSLLKDGSAHSSVHTGLRGQAQKNTAPHPRRTSTDSTPFRSALRRRLPQPLLSVMLAVLLPLSALSALPALLPLSALALPTLSTARAPIGGETPFVGARAGVIATLFPGLGKPLQRLLGGEQGFTAKRRAVLRWRIAERRAEVERCSRELEALAAREYRAGRPEAPAVRVARQERVAQLRRAAGQAEASILRYKARLGAEERPGWLGVAARAAETFTASEERSARVLWTRLRQADPWDALRQDAASLLRLGSNVTLARGYLQLSSSSRLVPHAAAIVARAAKLERHAPGILLAVDRDGILEPPLGTF